MTQVFFYHNAPDRLAAALGLLGKTALQKKKIVVFAPETATAEGVDRGLWTHSALGFYPHCMAHSPLAEETPVLIASDLDGALPTARLMNLSDTLPVGYQRFDSLIEVVSTDDACRQAARQRVREYQAAGCDVRYFDLGPANP